MADIALRFGPGLDPLIEQVSVRLRNSKRSRATLRILRLNRIQRWLEDKMQDWPSYFSTGPKMKKTAYRAVVAARYAAWSRLSMRWVVFNDPAKFILDDCTRCRSV